VQGSLVEVADVGALIQGPSGIGKSECALELIMRGHRIVADDVVWVSTSENGHLEGRPDELVRGYMELRGIGIVHVPSLFGANAVLEAHRIDLLVRLEVWGTGEVERTGLEPGTEALGGQELPVVRIPVAPGRNVAALVEAAARNQRIRQLGGPGASELDARVRARLRGDTD
jgi:HPr kinase/phosphorylase